MTISRSLDKLPGVRGICVDFDFRLPEPSQLSFRVAVEPDSPADQLFAECGCPLIGVGYSKGLPDGRWYRLTVQRAATPGRRETNETAEENKKDL